MPRLHHQTHRIAQEIQRLTLESEALREHRLMWTLPALLTRRPPAAQDAEGEKASGSVHDQGIQRVRQQKIRIQRTDTGLPD